MTPIPRIASVNQIFNQPEIADVAGAVASLVRSSRIQQRVPKGGSVAVTVGSRGVAEIALIARTVVDELKALGFKPFIVAAMGSHGGGTEQGQRSILASYGVDERSMRCPVETSMDTVVLGSNSLGLPIRFDRNAYEADGIVLLNRIKPHTSFKGAYESGLLKMLAIGLGKREGAAQVHKLGLPGLTTILPEVGSFLLQKTKVALGLAVLENANDRIARVVAVEPEDLLEQEPKLLDEARSLMPSLPFDQIDVLIVGELGKNFSGTGMDPNVIGRQRVETMPDLPRPQVTRLAVLDLSVETQGNALGVGLADLITRRLAERIDPEPIRVNCFTSNFLTRARVPLALETDREVVQACIDTCWQIFSEQIRMVVIPNTLELSRLWISPALEKETKVKTDLEFSGDWIELPFDDSGTLDQEFLFPQSQRGRRLKMRQSH